MARSDRATWHDRATLVKPRFLGFRDLGFAVERKTQQSRRASAKKAILSSLFLFPNTIGEIECKLRDCNIQIESRIVIAIFVL